MMKFKAWDKKENRFRDDVAITPSGNVFIIRGSIEFDKLVNNWYKKQGDVLGGSYGEIDYSDWYAATNIEITFEATE